MSETDHEFHIRLMRGHPTAFDDVLRWYADDVLRLATFLLNDADEAHDILQETMLRFVEEIKKKRVYLKNGSIKPLLMTISRNLCINRIKKSKRLIEFPDGWIDQLPHRINHQTPEHMAAEAEFETAFHEALSLLSPLQRAVFVLHELQQDSFHEIAQVLNISYESTKKHFYRGLKKMREFLK